MSRHSGLVRLRHMRDSAREAVSLVEGKTRRDLEHTRLAAARAHPFGGDHRRSWARVPKETRDELPAIPWADVVGMRNKLIHGYNTVDLDILWDTVKNELPALIEALEEEVDSGTSE